MSTLGQLLSTVAARRFVGRRPAREQFSQFLGGEISPSIGILNYWGHAGMGKSSLLWNLAGIADEEGVASAVVGFSRQMTPLLFLRTLQEQLPYSKAAQGVDQTFAADVIELSRINSRLIAALDQEKEAPVAPERTSDWGEAGEVAGKILGEVVAAETGVPLLGSFTAVGGNALGAQVTRWQLRQLAKQANISEEDLAFVANITVRLTRLMLKSLELRGGEEGRYVLFLDHHEYASLYMDEWLRTDFLPDLPLFVKLVIFRRRPLTDLRSWEEFEPAILECELKPFDEAEALEFWSSRGIDDSIKAAALNEIVEGHPYKSDLLSGLLKKHSDARSMRLEEIERLGAQADIDERLMARYLKEVESDSERELLRVCAVPRWFDRDLLAELAPDSAALYHQLADISFVESHSDGGLALHSLARKAILEQETVTNPLVIRGIHRKIADHLATRRQQTGGMGPEYFRDEIYHRLSDSAESGLEFALSVVREARLLGLHVVEDNAWAEIADFPFGSGRGKTWKEFATAHTAVRGGDWNEALAGVEQLNAAAWPDMEFGLRVTKLHLELLTGRGGYDTAYTLEDEALRRGREGAGELSRSLSFDLCDLKARHVETCAILGRFDEAFKALDETLDEVDEGTFPAARLLLAGATACRLKGDVNRGILLAKEAVAVHQKNGDPRALCFALIQQARLETHGGRWTLAYEILYSADKLEKSAGDQYNRANVLLFRANILRKKGQFEEALDQYEKSLHLHQAMRSDREIGPLYGSLGVVHARLGDMTLARSYLDESISMKERQSYYRGAGISHIYYGSYHLVAGRPEVARGEFAKAEAIGRELGLPYLIWWSRLGLSRCRLRGLLVQPSAGDPNSDLAAEGFGSDIRGALALYESVLKLSGSGDGDEAALEGSLRMLVSYNPFWAREIVDDLVADLKQSSSEEDAVTLVLGKLGAVARGNGVATAERSALKREGLPDDPSFLAGVFEDDERSADDGD